jgi:hypothetical protein
VAPIVLTSILGMEDNGGVALLLLKLICGMNCVACCISCLAFTSREGSVHSRIGFTSAEVTHPAQVNLYSFLRCGVLLPAGVPSFS